MKHAVVDSVADAKSIMDRAESRPRIKTASEVVAADKGISLDAMGVSSIVQDRYPSDLYYPSGFNPEARVHWMQMFSSPLFAKDMSDHPYSKDAWTFAVQYFMNICHNEGINPFRSRGKLDQRVNDDVRTMLFNRRLRLKTYLDHSRLFTVVKVLPITARHGYKELSTGNLQVTASIQFEMENGEALAAYLTSHMRMIRDGQGFRRNLLTNLNVVVNNIRLKRATLNYILEIRPPYFVPDAKKSKQERHDYFDRQFFHPMIRGFRFNTLQRRIKF